MTKAGLWTVLLVSSLLLISTASAASQELQLNGPLEPVSEGFFNLSFTGAENASKVIIQRSATASFDEITSQYSPMGSFHQLALSGFSTGEYYFRAQENGRTSNLVMVTVQHHSLTQAFTLFLIGAVMFILLVVTILRYQFGEHNSKVGGRHA